MPKVKNLDTFIEDRLRAGQKAVKVFADRFAEDPAHAFRWGDSAVEGAARVAVYTAVSAALTSPESKATHDTVLEYARREVRRRSADVPRGSIQTANLLAQYELTAWADLLAFMEGG